jgi:6-pyruvoyltetrahydropterin/6-carboxytetrahydropterin synthase
MFEVTKRFTFEAAHQLRWHEGKCQNLHGHSYKLEVTIMAEDLGVDGVVVDFHKLGDVVNEQIVDVFDHKFLNDYFSNPTAEVMAREICHALDKAWKEEKLPGQVKSVRLCETEKCNVYYETPR